MSNVSSRRTSFTWIIVLIITAVIGWLLYRFMMLDLVALRNSPPSLPPITLRSDWNARPLNLEASEEYGLFDPQINPAGVLIYSDDLRSVLNTIVVHHSATAYSTPNEVQDLHMDGRGFADVAYHYLIDAEGSIYEGRELNIRGAHVQGFNTGSVGIVLLGNFNDDLPEKSQLSSLQELIDYLRFTYEIRYLAGHKDYPHQSPDGTECPGNNLYPLLLNLAKSLGMNYGIDGYVNPYGLNN
jgi:hypothetical protein